MLKVENLVKDFKTGFLRASRSRVLKEVSLSVRPGEIYGFIGPNGAGKTTTFKSILGFINITSGKIELMGKPVGDVNVRNRIGYLPENPYFYDHLTGEELLRYMGELHGIDSRELSERIDDLLEKVKMNHARETQLRKYSKGMLQRVGIAQSLINNPEFLILDEPLSGLDPIGQAEIKQLILDQKKNGTTIILSSHILSDVEVMCDRVGVIIGGRVVKEGEIGKLLEEIHSDYELRIIVNNEDIAEKLNQYDVVIEELSGFTILRFDESLKDSVINIVSQTDAEIISMNPVRKSLEGLFVEAAKDDVILET